MASKLGMHVTVAHPEGFPLDRAVEESAKRAAHDAGGSFRVVNDLASGVKDADAVYAAPWGSINLQARPDAEGKRREQLSDWRITPGVMASTADAHFLHAMPIRRNIEADDTIVDAPGSLVVEQAGNRLHVQRALFRSVLGV